LYTIELRRTTDKICSSANVKNRMHVETSAVMMIYRKA